MDLQAVFYTIAITWMVVMIAIMVMIGVFIFLLGRSLLELTNMGKSKLYQIQEVLQSSLIKRASLMTIMTPIISLIAKKVFESKRR